MTVAEAWAVIHRWLEKNCPHLRRKLKKPASLKAIKHLEKHIGVSLPESVIASYQIHDGCDGGVIIGLPLLSLKEVEQVWDTWASVVGPTGNECPDADRNEGFSSYEKGKVKELYANKRWIPLAGSDSNYAGLDFDPGPKGRIGQVINFGRDDQIRYVLAETFEGFLSFIADQFATDKVEVNPEQSEDEDPDFLVIKGVQTDPLTQLPVYRDLLTGLSLLFGDKRPKGKKPGNR
jgi:cell wall assembly regulator SMI1